MPDEPITPHPASFLRAFVLAKNEARNIARCLDALRPLEVPVVVLDSGSVDDTPAIARQHPFASVLPYRYVSHRDAYNDITTRLATGTDYALVVDADTLVTGALVAEVRRAVSERPVDVLAAPVRMWWNGRPLPFGSLYPPKPFLFRTGSAWFEAAGHGERIRPGVRVQYARSPLVHDDRKEYDAFLLAQARYANNLCERWRSGQVGWRDRLRTGTPLLILLAPFWTLVGRLGILSGRTGLIYALDRLIAEAIFHRQALAARDGDAPPPPEAAP
jgi:(heptosyl)LPS beta-1,4-glucosyltransferase